MKDWENKALILLEKSLNPLPQELNELDWKVNISEKGDRIARHLSAFSNYSGGGFLVFGVNNEGTMVGVDQDQCRSIIEKIGNISRSTVEPQIIVDHLLSKIGEANILFLYIPEAPSKPVHIKSSDIYESYTRTAGQTRKMNKQEVALIISSSTNLTFETKLATGILDIQDILSRLDFVSYFDLIKKNLPKDSQSIIDALASERLVKKVEEGYCITNLGAILFAKDFNDFKDLQRRATRVIVYSGKGRIQRIKEVEGRKGYASGFVNLLGYINTMLPSNEIILA